MFFDLKRRGGWPPYVGAGIGDARVTLHDYRVNDMPLIDDSASAFAFQLIAGVRYHISPQWPATLDYRYFRTADPEVTNAAGETMQTSVHSHALLFGLTRAF